MKSSLETLRAAFCFRYVNIEEQDLTSMNPDLSERKGFVLVEWGGGNLG